MSKNEITLVYDEEKCVGCGMCAKDCPSHCFEMIDGKAHLKNGFCLYCGHCESICSQHALHFEGYSDEVIDFSETPRLDSDELLLAIKARRSVRRFESKKVEKEKIEKIIEAGRVSPTAVNKQGTSFVVLNDDIEKYEKIALKAFPGKKNPGFFFKGAPLAILVISSDTVSASLAASNMALMAEAQGLGVFFSGYFTIVSRISGKLRRTFGTNRKNKVVTTLVIGYPSVKYVRTAHRNPAKIKWL